MLPIDRTTLVGGTADAGRTIHSGDVALNMKLRRAGRVLNLRPHMVRGHLMYSATDLEGHYNRQDGRHYLLDFSRVMPPAAPSGDRRRAGDKRAGGIFVRLLRAEFVAKYPRPLCSDAYSGFRDAADGNRHEKDIARACKDLAWLYVGGRVVVYLYLFLLILFK